MKLPEGTNIGAAINAAMKAIEEQKDTGISKIVVSFALSAPFRVFVD